MDGKAVKEALDGLDVSPVVVASHPRSGTHLTIDVLRRQFEACDSWKWPLESPARLYVDFESLFRRTELPTSERKALALLRRCSRPIIKTHELLDLIPLGESTCPGRLGRYWLDWLRERATWLCVCRDGRDVMCSFHLFSQGFEPRADVDIHAFLRQKVDGVSRPRLWSEHVRRWIRREGVHVLKFESLLREPEATIGWLAGVLGLEPRWRDPALPPRTPTAWAGRVDRLIGVRPESSAILGRYGGSRKPVKWRQAFTPEDHEFFNREVGDLLVELGYDAVHP